MTPEQALRDHAEPWQRERAGEFCHWSAHVWWCGDEVCDCSQAKIQALFKNTWASGYVIVDVWWGTFFSDGEQGAAGELQRALAYLLGLAIQRYYPI